MRSAIFSSTRARSCTEVLPQASAAACAASRARSTSWAVERGNSAIGWPLTGELLVKYWPANRLHELAIDEVAISWLEGHDGAWGSGLCVDHAEPLRVDACPTTGDGPMVKSPACQANASLAAGLSSFGSRPRPRVSNPLPSCSPFPLMAGGSTKSKRPERDDRAPAKFVYRLV